MKMIVHVAIAEAVENDHKVSHDLNFHPFFLAPFSPLSWSLVKQAYLDLKEFSLSYRTKNNPQHPSHLSLCKGPKPKFLSVFHALTDCVIQLPSLLVMDLPYTEHRYLPILN